MRVLLIKTSSMGDVIHALPALTDAGRAIPGIQFDWMVEDVFSDIPRWHPQVKDVIPVALRRWRHSLLSSETHAEWRALRANLRERQYDIVLDAQGLMKSALLSFFANGERVGLGFRSAREFIASFAYQRKCTVNFYQHAIVRMRLLFSEALKYKLPNAAPDFNLKRLSSNSKNNAEKYIVFLHGTTWESKLWPEEYWIQLAKLAAVAGYRIKISGASEEEIARANRIANQCSAVDAIPRLSIPNMAALLANAKAAVAVDTGFGHLAAALNVPTISIYGSTNPDYTGAIGKNSTLVSAQFPCAPCYQRNCSFKQASVVKPACYGNITPQRVWSSLLNANL